MRSYTYKGFIKKNVFRSNIFYSLITAVNITIVVTLFINNLPIRPSGRSKCGIKTFFFMNSESFETSAQFNIHDGEKRHYI